MRRVLIITYYWPPSGGSGVQRWLKFSKYLPEFGWQPVIYTPENPMAPASDTTLLSEIPKCAEVVKTKIMEPYSIYQKFTGGKSGKGEGYINPINDVRKKSFKERISMLIRANVFVPDPRISWRRSSVKFLCSYLKEHPVDAIVSTGPPHSMHLIAKDVAHKTRIRWVADFRDPWTTDFSFKHLPMTAGVLRRHKKMEMSVLGESDAVTVVTNSMKKEYDILLEKAGGKKTPVFVVHNGFDESDFNKKPDKLDDQFSLAFSGLFNVESNPTSLWKVLGEMAAEDMGFKKNLNIRLIGKVDKAVTDSIEAEGLSENLIKMGYLDHPQTTLWQQKVRVLLLPLRRQPEAAGILSGKYFEYLAAGRPIVAFGPLDSELAYSLKEASAGEMFDWNETDRLKRHIETLYNDYLSSTDGLPTDIPVYNSKIASYSRKSLTLKMVKILNSDGQD